jgi:glycosyltransferase involved in cell wall biosynthesis
VQLEFTQMAQYAAACGKTKTILIEHDITWDLQRQLLARNPGDWELERQFRKWQTFETEAWKQVDCVVAVSPKDEAAIEGARRAACLPNGVDTERFQPSPREPEPRRLLFIGSFAHLPNVLALEFFVGEVWPLLGPGYLLHVIAGLNPERFPLKVNLSQPGIELEGFVPDVRDAYARAEIVIVPLTASAGTNIKVLEAMAMGRLVISTRAGINGLDVRPGIDLIVVDSAAAMTETIQTVKRGPFEVRARETALRYDWKEIARQQSELYRSLVDGTSGEQ